MRGSALAASAAAVLLTWTATASAQPPAAPEPSPNAGVAVNAANGAEAAAADGGASDGPTQTEPAAASTDPDVPTVTVRTDVDHARVGDPVAFVVTVIGRRGVPVNLPTTLDLGAFSLLDRKEAEQDIGDGRLRREFTLQVAAYEPGDMQIPSVEVTYLSKAGEIRTLKTAALPIKIVSLLANEPEPALKENAPPVPVRQEDLRLLYAAVALGVAAVSALITYLIVRRLRRRVIVRRGPPPRPAHEVALERLDRLGALGFLENADNRPFYFAVSEIIREYLGARFGFDSLELTTDELMAELRQHAPRELLLVEIESWLQNCDLVKFAKISPSAAECRAALGSAIHIVEATRPRPEPQGQAMTGGETHV